LIVSIKLGDVIDGTFECRGREEGICDECRLRFKCLTEQQEIRISANEVKKYKLSDLKNLAYYMFGKSKISYEIAEVDREFGKKLVARMK